MAAIDWPTNLRKSVEFAAWPTWQQVGQRSPYTGGSEVMTRWHQWRAQIRWGVLTHDQAHALEAFLHRLEGRRFTVRIPNWRYRRSIGTKTGSVSTSGSHVVGATGITLTGGSGLFFAGDYFQIVQESGVPRMYQVVQGEDELGGGNVTIKPGLRVAHGGGAVVDHLGKSGVTEIKETMEMTSDYGPAAMFPSPSPGYVSGPAVDFVSALRTSFL